MRNLYTVFTITALAGLVWADHRITVINNCDYAVTPTVNGTSCSYSTARCRQTSIYDGPGSITVEPGKEGVFNIPNNWVGRLFHQNGSCGSEGWGCSLLEFNFDNGDTATKQSYDLSSIQGFTIGQKVVPSSQDGCQTKTCFSANCANDQAYPVGDMHADGSNTSCGQDDLGLTLYYCKD